MASSFAQIVEEGAFEEGYRYVEDMMIKRCDFFEALRLLCLLCITNNGIPKKVNDALRKTMLLCYGCPLPFQNALKLTEMTSLCAVVMRM